MDAALRLEFGTVRGMGDEDQDFVLDMFVLEFVAVERVLLSISMSFDSGGSLSLRSSADCLMLKW